MSEQAKFAKKKKITDFQALKLREAVYLNNSVQGNETYKWTQSCDIAERGQVSYSPRQQSSWLATTVFFPPAAPKVHVFKTGMNSWDRSGPRVPGLDRG